LAPLKTTYSPDEIVDKRDIESINLYQVLLQGAVIGGAAGGGRLAVTSGQIKDIQEDVILTMRALGHIVG
jgi:hypothetical protein